MRNTIRSLALFLALQPALASAQTQLPTLPPNTVLGRLGISSGPAQAIQFSTLQAQLASGITTRTSSSPITPSDCFKTIQLGTGSTGFFTIQAPAIGGFPSVCPISVINSDTARAKGVIGLTGAVIPGCGGQCLWQGQRMNLLIVNGAWQASQSIRWKAPTGTTCYVDVINGNDSNDCLAAGSGNAVKTLFQAGELIIHQQWDLDASAAPQAVIQLADNGGCGGGTTYAGLHLAGPSIGGDGHATIVIQGNAATPSNVCIFDTTNAPAIALFDNAIVEIKNMAMKSTSNHTLTALGGGTSFRLEGGVIFAGAGSGQADILLQNGAQGFTDANYTVGGTSSYHVLTTDNAAWTSGAHQVTCSGATAYSDFVFLQRHAIQNWLGATFSGCGSVTGQRYYEDGGSHIETGGGGANFFPGNSAGSPFGGATYDGALPMGTSAGGTGGATPAAAQAALQVRGQLQGATTYFVNANSGGTAVCGTTGALTCSAGSNSNNGLSIAAPFLTLQHAIDVIANNVDSAGQSPIINLAHGSSVNYAAFCGGGGAFLGTAVVQVTGDSAAPTAVTIVDQAGGYGLQIKDGCTLDLSNVAHADAATNNGAGHILVGGNGNSGHLDIHGITLGSMTVGTQMTAASLGSITATGGNTISGGAPIALKSQGSGLIDFVSQTVTVSGTPAFSTAFAFMADGGEIGATNTTFSGAATGKRCLVAGPLNLGAYNPNAVFPGNVDCVANEYVGAVGLQTGSGGSSAFDYGAAGALLTSGGGASAKDTWSAPGQIPATATNDNASAGNIGQIISSNVASGSAVSLTTGAAANVTSISLTAGDWDVMGNICLLPNAATTMSFWEGWISTTTAAAPTLPNAGAAFLLTTTFTTGNQQCQSAGTMRQSLSGTTTVFLSTTVNFGVNTNAAYGYLQARRAR